MSEEGCHKIDQILILMQRHLLKNVIFFICNTACSFNSNYAKCFFFLFQVPTLNEEAFFGGATYKYYKKQSLSSELKGGSATDYYFWHLKTKGAEAFLADCFFCYCHLYVFS